MLRHQQEDSSSQENMETECVCSLLPRQQQPQSLIHPEPRLRDHVAEPNTLVTARLSTLLISSDFHSCELAGRLTWLKELWLMESMTEASAYQRSLLLRTRS